MLVLFHSSINSTDKHVCGIESDSPSEQPESKHHYKAVPKVEKRGHELCDVKLGEVIHDRVAKDVVAGWPWKKEWSPPPVIVLPTQLKVGHHYGDLWAGYDEDHKHKEKEAKQIVKLVLPNGC